MFLMLLRSVGKVAKCYEIFVIGLRDVFVLLNSSFTPRCFLFSFFFFSLLFFALVFISEVLADFNKQPVRSISSTC